MPRAQYMPAEARCRQLERIIKNNPGITVTELSAAARLHYDSAAAYVTRLEREQRIDVVRQEPACARGCVKWLYPHGLAPAERKAA